MFKGMDLPKIAQIAQIVKAKQAADVFVVLNLNSEAAVDGVLHTNVLLELDDNDTVITHDPAKDPAFGMAYKQLDKGKLHSRWAVAGNSGYMVIVPES